jgi:hypothetical protein
MKKSYSSLSSSYSLENQLLEIEQIFLTGIALEDFYRRESVYDFIKKGNDVYVGIFPNPKLTAVVSKDNEKYVRSSTNKCTHDNLLSLPRE